MAVDRIEVGWEAVSGLLLAMAAASVTLWGTVQSNKADISSMRSTMEMIREDTQYLRGRLDGIADRNPVDE